MKKIINKNEKGITLIALVITIIVLLLLAGVAISMLSGENGILNKTTEATYETEVGEIKEALGLKITELLAINEGKVQEYSLTLDNLNISDELKSLYRGKLKISEEGKLCYDPTVVTNVDEQNKFKELGIEEFVENNTGNSYTFKLSDIMTKGTDQSDYTRIIPVSEFWPEDVSEELKNNAFDVEFRGVYCASNITCSYSEMATSPFPDGVDGFTNPFAPDGDKNFEKPWVIYAMRVEDEIWIAVNTETGFIGGSTIDINNYIGSGFENLEITIGLPQQ